jgi:AcrR family transcriptional regulator
MKGFSTQNGAKGAQETQKRLLDAAEELFAQKGFGGTSIREITTKAERYPTAINYFFGNMQELYEELFRRRLRQMRDTRIEAIKGIMEGRGKATLEKLLHAYAEAFLEPFSDPQRSRHFMQLFSRELVEQRLPKNMFLEEMATPVMSALEEALAVICPGIKRRDVQMCIHSMMGQLIHVIHVKTMFAEQQGSVAVADIDEAIDHIVKFSAAGIRAFEKSG